MTTLLVTGVRGQLARALAALSPKFAELGYTMRQVGRPDFDFDRPATIEAVFHAAAPALVINAAGWTAVDLAETEPDAAARANDTGPARLARLCAAAGIPFIHISTDYVFDGNKGALYVETDRPNPTGVYGATKLAGERKIGELGGRHVILRTSWLYDAEGKNFVRTMLAAAQKTNALRVVADQRGCPTSAYDLADAVAAIAASIAAGWRDEYGGIFHAAGEGDTTWYDFARTIFDAASANGRARPLLTPIATADWPTAARRPADSRLDCGKLYRVYGVRLPHWQSSVVRVVDRICGAGR
jgi:dTDP-4-dehydrorhamnose reductase